MNFFFNRSKTIINLGDFKVRHIKFFCVFRFCCIDGCEVVGKSRRIQLMVLIVFSLSLALVKCNRISKELVVG